MGLIHTFILKAGSYPMEEDQATEYAEDNNLENDWIYSGGKVFDFIHFIEDLNRLLISAHIPESWTIDWRVNEQVLEQRRRIIYNSSTALSRAIVIELLEQAIAKIINAGKGPESDIVKHFKNTQKLFTYWNEK